MSKKAEILHKLSADDRVYLSEKFKEKDTKIAELQDKLAKKDGEITRRLVLQEKDYEEEINQLKQQLSEKEKEMLEYVEIVDGLHKQLSDKCDFCEKEYKRQLAEKDSELDKWSTVYARAYVNRQNALIAEKVELKEQLAEKEKEIERIKNNYIGGMQNANEATRIFKEEYYKASRDKISFCIEQLEKLKGEFDCIYSNDTYTPYQIDSKIDDQIKELKEGK